MAVESAFEQFLQDRLSYKQYEELDILLNISQHRLTKCLSNPRIMDVKEVRQLSNLCNVDAEDLIFTYDCGMEGMTVSDAISLGLLKNEKAA
jgi:hypothetical protein